MFSPLVRHKRLIAELKKLRDTAGMTSDQLAKAIGQSRMKVSRLENAAGRPNVPDVMRILKALEVPEPRWSELVSLAQEATMHGWWESFQGPGKVAFAQVRRVSMATDPAQPFQPRCGGNSETKRCHGQASPSAVIHAAATPRATPRSAR